MPFLICAMRSKPSAFMSLSTIEAGRPIRLSALVAGAIGVGRVTAGCRATCAV